MMSIREQNAVIPEFTIVIPVYNSEGSIYKCLKSVQNQSLDSYEVLIIDDGSTDQSKDICQRFNETDKRFHLICQHNSGPSSARNKGLNIASGRFVAFIDSDDFVEPNYLEGLSAAFLKYKADAVFIGYTVFSSAGDKIEENIPDKYSNEYFEQLAGLAAHDLFGYTWVKAFRRTVIGTNRFPENISLFEDEIFTCDVLKHCSSVGIVSHPVYNYTRDSVNTLMGKTRKDYVALQDRVYAAWQRLMEHCDERDKWLCQRANALAVSCEYYFFEREVPENDYLEALKSAVYIRDCSISDPFYEAVRRGRWEQLKIIKRKYRLKMEISRLLHK